MAERNRDYIEFVEVVGPRLRRTAYLVCGDWHAADDVVQDALHKLYLAWGKVSRAKDPVSYARRVVVNAALDASRRPWRREVPSEMMPDLLGDPRSGDPAAEHADRDEVHEALGALPPRMRACVVLRYYEDLSVEQTADILDCSAGTVKSQSARGLEALREAILRSRPLGHVG